MRRQVLKAIVLTGAVVGTALTAADAQANPAFARKYHTGCNTCHSVYPRLNRFGRDFRDNGFRMPAEMEQVLKKRTGAPPAEDFWSFVPEQIPFSIQAKMHGVLKPKSEVETDFQLEELQLQSGGTFTPRVSYYLHHHLAEEGRPGDVYAAWVRFNNLAGSDSFGRISSLASSIRFDKSAPWIVRSRNCT